MSAPATPSGSASILLGVFAIVCGLLPLTFALTHAGVELRRRSGPFGIAGEYQGYVIFYLVLTLIPVALGIEAIWRKKRGVVALVIALIIAMFAAVTFPSNYVDRARTARSHVQGTARMTGERLVGLSEERGRFPDSEEQFRLLEGYIRQGWTGERFSRSPYARDGESVPYRLQFVGNASRPHLPTPPGAEPSIIYCAVSLDLKTLWITATGLEHEGGNVVFVPDPDAPERPLALRFQALEQKKPESGAKPSNRPGPVHVDPPPADKKPEVRG